MSFKRKFLSFQPDVLEWMDVQKNVMRRLRAEQYKLEKGFVAYAKDVGNMIKEYNNPPEAVPTSAEDAERSRKAMDQYYESQDILKRMKWKRVTWDDMADYDGFSKRVFDNDAMFKNVNAFSFMSIHIQKDPSTNEFVKAPVQDRTMVAGALTNWVLQERDAAPVEKYPVKSTAERRSAFTVDWAAGEVRILDTASAQEILTFLLTVAPRLQAIQLKMEAQQTRITENVENVRVRVGTILKFNQHNTSFWDDPIRKTDPNYVNPDELEMFLNAMLKSAFLYRWFLKGQVVRVIQPGRPFFVDIEKKELQIPANFADYNWLTAHSYFESVESVFNSFRRFWWAWFCVGMVLISDVDIL
ncbi:hypothetical protein STCU_04886 [Strigomonas culicis]|uniref:Uncharacterized protein n=1 Tax=Strigomonas culicis TaxID=28005 RepID=S9V4I1_9TRYP|nr:hypothetical protein STCU_08477 [Strigomonas culicis]EPY27940.1 hypothetical protein STCU_05398 [Strigomonas culicis]EPY28777.1 hypothetical protein STCU_04886 [Strigomonas culicis]|eukprot:EPY21811.1 hypothetical protein STCU_08477 [Strigomonas culicis]